MHKYTVYQNFPDFLSPFPLIDFLSSIGLYICKLLWVSVKINKWNLSNLHYWWAFSCDYVLFNFSLSFQPNSALKCQTKLFRVIHRRSATCQRCQRLASDQHNPSDRTRNWGQWKFEFERAICLPLCHLSFCLKPEIVIAICCLAVSCAHK